jgi:hypothetical protein
MITSIRETQVWQELVSNSGPSLEPIEPGQATSPVAPQAQQRFCSLMMTRATMSNQKTNIFAVGSPQNVHLAIVRPTRSSCLGRGVGRMIMPIFNLGNIV